MLVSEQRRFSSMETVERVLSKSKNISKILVKLLSSSECDMMNKSEIEHLRSCCEKVSDNNLTPKELADRFFRDGKFEDAVNEYTKSLKLDPCNHAARLNRAAALLKMKAFERARTDCVVVIAASKKCTEKQLVKALFRKGRALEAMGHIDEAIAAYERASKLEPTNEKIRNVLQSLSD